MKVSAVRVALGALLAVGLMGGSGAVLAEDGARATHGPSPASSPSAGRSRPQSPPSSLPAQPGPPAQKIAGGKSSGEPPRVAPIDRDKVKEQPPHPLALKHPEHFVVVCEANCARGGPIVTMRPIANAKIETVTVGEVQPTASEDEAPKPPPPKADLTCLAGCYGKQTANADWHKLAGEDASWSGSSQWMTSGDAHQAKAAGDRRAKPVGTSGDWMRKINADRDRRGRGG